MQEAIALEAARFAPVELRAELLRHSLEPRRRRARADRRARRQPPHEERGRQRPARPRPRRGGRRRDRRPARRALLARDRAPARPRRPLRRRRQPAPRTPRRAIARRGASSATSRSTPTPPARASRWSPTAPSARSAAAPGVRRLTDEALARGRAALPRGRPRVPAGRLRRRRRGASTTARPPSRVAALSYSHAVTDVARLFRHVWTSRRGTGARPARRRPCAAAGGAD